MLDNWVYEPVIGHYEMHLFHNALCRHSDLYYYYPIAVARCIEAGPRYRFLCIAKPKTLSPMATNHFVIIEIYKPCQGMPYATRLCKICMET